MPNGEKSIYPSRPNWVQRDAFWEWARETYTPEQVAILEGYGVAIYTSPYWAYWYAYDRPYRLGGQPEPVSPLSRKTYEEGLSDIFRGYVDRGSWTKAKAKVEKEQIDYWLNTYGLTPGMPYYDAVVASRTRQAGQEPSAAGLAMGLPGGMTGEEYARATGQRPTTEFLPGGGIRTTVGPLAFGATRPPKQPGLTSSQVEARIRASLPTLSSAVGMLETALAGQSPAMQSYFMSQFPYLFEKIGGEEGRVASQVAYKKRMGQLGALGEKRRGAQWVLGKKAEYLPKISPYGPVYPYGPAPVGTSYEESYEATRRKIESLRRQEAGFGKLRKPEDPWLTFLRKYPFMETFIKQPPAERGYYPARYAPPTQWI